MVKDLGVIKKSLQLRDSVFPQEGNENCTLVDWNNKRESRRRRHFGQWKPLEIFFLFPRIKIVVVNEVGDIKKHLNEFKILL